MKELSYLGNPVLNWLATEPADSLVDTALDTCLRFEIPSDFAEGRRLQRCILDELARFHYGPDATFAIRLAVEEALINAIKHGNKLDPTKAVRVQVTINPHSAEIIIEDQGQGFERCCVPDPTQEENLERLHGRGIMLIESYMDEVNWCCGGRRVRMVRRNDASRSAGGEAANG